MSNVTPIGKDLYMVGVSVRGGFTGDTEVKAKALDSANAFCTSLGRRMALVSSSSSGVQGWTPQNAEIQFRCEPTTQ